MIKRVPGLFRGDTYQARVFRGTMLTIISFGGENFLRLASNIVLTRLLFPEAFGIMALVMVVLTGVDLFSDIGIRDSVIRDKRGTETSFLNTAWTLDVVRGFILAVVVLLLATPLARFYEAPVLADILVYASIVPIIQGFTSTRVYTVNRELLLGRLTAVVLGSQCVGIATMVLFAWWLNSVWALVIGMVVSSATNVILSHLAIPGTPNRLSFEIDAARRIFGYGKYIFLATIGSYFVSQGDKAVLGKFVTLDTLAIYNIGFFFAMVPILFAETLNDRVIFPAYVHRTSTESAAVRNKINKARFFLTTALILGTGLLALVGEPIVRLLYDDRYVDAGIILVLIALASMPRLVTLSYEKLPLAFGHSGRYAALTVTRSAVQFALLVFGVQNFGLLGAIIAPLLAWALSYPFLVFLARFYQGWDARHDALFIVLSLLIAVPVLWIYEDLVIALLTR